MFGRFCSKSSNPPKIAGCLSVSLALCSQASRESLQPIDPELWVLRFCSNLTSRPLMSAASAPNLLKYFLAASAQGLDSMIFKITIGTSDGCLLLALSSKAFWKDLKSSRLQAMSVCFCSKSSNFKIARLACMYAISAPTSSQDP